MNGRSSADTDAHEEPPVFQSRLRAKREERMRQHQHQHQQLPQHEPDVGSDCVPVGVITQDTFPVAEEPKHSSRTAVPTTARSTTDDVRRRQQRAEARRLLIDYTGSVWDVVRANDVAMLRNFVLVEGATNKNADAEFGRTLLHTAAWSGCYEAAAFLLANGASVDQIDTTATRVTPLMDAARAGHSRVGVLLLEHNANATLTDRSGDNAFHWAARHRHGDFLLCVSLALDAMNHHTAVVDAWTAKNIRGRTPADYIRMHATIFSMICKRLGPRGVPLHPRPASRPSRFSISGMSSSSSLPTTADIASVVAGLDTATTTTNGGLDSEAGLAFDSGGSRPSSAQIAASRDASQLSGVDALGLDVSSFAYKSRDSIPSH